MGVAFSNATDITLLGFTWRGFFLGAQAIRICPTWGPQSQWGKFVDEKYPRRLELSARSRHSVVLLTTPQVFEDAVEEVVAVKKSGKKLPRPISKLSKKIRGKVNNNNDVDNVEETLGDALEEAKASVDLFLNNNYDEAKNIVQPM